MIVTLAWKELREHWPVWFTMVVLTILLGPGLGQIISGGNPGSQAQVHLTILGLAGAYGAVCGAMMLAGEHEGGTITHLDIFLGRRGLLWLGKFGIGVVLVATQAGTVALVLALMKQAPPQWGWALLGLGKQGVVGMPAGGALPVQPTLWFLILPVVTLEAYAWGLLGSALSRRVLSAAAVAAGVATPVWLLAVMVPSVNVFALRVVVAFVVLVISHAYFLSSLGETPRGVPPSPERRSDRRRRALEQWDRMDQRGRERRGKEEERPARAIPVVVAIEEPASFEEERPPPLPRRIPGLRRREYEEAGSPRQALFWLTFQQGWGLFCVLAGFSLFVGFFLPYQGQLLWPVATLMLGVACGIATFAPEQRDLSYQFLAAQHLPLRGVWRFKVGFWFSAAVLLILPLLLGGLIASAGRTMLPDPARGGPREMMPVLQFGTLRGLLGPVLYFGVWLVYGFITGLLFVWLCRKMLLALLLSSLVGAAAILVWFPSLLSGGMSGWQVWLAPVVILGASYSLVRAWAGGRIKERRPLAALIGLTFGIVAWLALNCLFRAWPVSDVGEPLDRSAFRASIPSGKANEAGQKIQEAMAAMDMPGKGELWLARMEEARRLPVGVIENPPSDGQRPLLIYLPACRAMSGQLRELARIRQQEGNHAAAWDHLARILALSRSMRNKAPLEAYLAGVQVEESALEGLEQWLAGAEPPADLLRRVLDELHRHAAQTPPALDCLQTECYRAGGMLANPSGWAFASGPEKVPETWLARAITLSLEIPWEEERKTRLWQEVWAGLFRALKTPHWELPPKAEDIPARKESTRRILRGWLPSEGGTTAVRLAALLDASWLSDEALYTPVLALRAAGNRARWRIDAGRLTVALGLYQIEEGKAAQQLEDLVPKYLPELPIDPYSGRGFSYRVSRGEDLPLLGKVRAGQGILWSTGPDRLDDGGMRQGGQFGDEEPQWDGGGMDLITLAPAWR